MHWLWHDVPIINHIGERVLPRELPTLLRVARRLIIKRDQARCAYFKSAFCEGYIECCGSDVHEFISGIQFYASYTNHQGERKSVLFLLTKKSNAIRLEDGGTIINLVPLCKGEYPPSIHIPNPLCFHRHPTRQ